MRSHSFDLESFFQKSSSVVADFSNKSVTCLFLLVEFNQTITPHAELGPDDEQGQKKWKRTQKASVNMYGLALLWLAMRFKLEEIQRRSVDIPFTKI